MARMVVRHAMYLMMQGQVNHMEPSMSGSGISLTTDRRGDWGQRRFEGGAWLTSSDRTYRHSTIAQSAHQKRLWVVTMFL